MTKAEVKTMMDDVDFNGDGRLDYEEVWKQFSLTKKKIFQMKKRIISKYEQYSLR